MVYLDANATTALDPAVLEAMLPFLRDHHGNPSSGHSAGRQTRAAIDSARDQLALLLHCRPHELIFTSSGTESDNLAILGSARASRSQGRGSHLITCATEHHAVLHAFDWLEKNEGFSVTRLPVSPQGPLDPASLEAALRPDTTLVSIMTANNETGVLHPVDAISKLCRSRGIPFHSDAVQSFGKTALTSEPFDLLSLAAHKFHGPKGVGLLFVRGGLPIHAQILGGAQEGQRRAGTENTPAIVGLAHAATLAAQRFQDDEARIGPLRDLMESELLGHCPGLALNGKNAPRLWNTSNVTFPSSTAENLLMALDLEGICASSGSACMVGSVQASHVLLAMGVPHARAASSLRFSLCRTTSAADIDRAVKGVARVWERLRE